MDELIFQCCKRTPKFLITYLVADAEKSYTVCSICFKLEYFQKFILTKKELLEA